MQSAGPRTANVRPYIIVIIMYIVLCIDNFTMHHINNKDLMSRACEISASQHTRGFAVVTAHANRCILFGVLLLHL